MYVKPILQHHLFDDDDEDYEDYDDFLDSLGSDDEMSTLNSLTEEAHLTKRAARFELNKLKRWFKKQLDFYSIKSRHKVVVCDSFCRYAAENDLDTDDYYFWCICMSSYGDFLFFNSEGYSQDEELHQYLLLRKELSVNIRRLSIERLTDSLYPKILQKKGYPYEDEPVAIISIDNIIDIVSDVINVDDSEILRDNLEYLTDKVTHSERLYALSPLIYYAAFTRYRKKMLCNTDYDMNIRNALKNIPYLVDEDNGKNIDNYIRHIELYIALRDNLVTDEKKKMICDNLFCKMSNICECKLIDWNTAALIRPLRLTYLDNGITVFPNGLGDNPFYCKKGSIAYNDVIGFEEYEQKNSRKLIIPKIRDYLYNNTDVCLSYIELLRDSKNDECTRFIEDIINRAGVMKCIKPYMLGLVHAVIMRELMGVIDEIMPERMLCCLDEFDVSEPCLCSGFPWIEAADKADADNAETADNDDSDEAVNESHDNEFERLRSEAESGWEKSMVRLGLRYIAGGAYCRQDIDEGRKWLEIAANQNDTDAMAILGYLKYMEYSKESLEEAEIWLDGAADNCDTDAMLFLATNIYLSNDYHLSDFYNEDKARILLKKASDLGNKAALLYLAALSSSDSEAAELYIRYSEQNDDN